MATSHARRDRGSGPFVVKGGEHKGECGVAEEPIVVRAARPGDMEALVGVQHRAFTRVALELDFDPAMMPPVQEDPEGVRAVLAEHPGSVLLVATTGGSDTGTAGRIVGTVRGVPGPGETVEIGRLAVEDGWERRGIATALMSAVEAAFPDARRFELFTGKDATGALHLYESLGYTLMTDVEWTANVPLVWLEKCRSRGVDSRS